MSAPSPRRETILYIGSFRVEQETIKKGDEHKPIPVAPSDGVSDDTNGSGLLGMIGMSGLLGLVVGVSAVGVYRRLAGHNQSRLRQLSYEVVDRVSESAGVMRRATEPVTLSRAIHAGTRSIVDEVEHLYTTLEMTDAKDRPMTVHVHATADEATHQASLGAFQRIGMRLMGAYKAPWIMQRVVVDVPDKLLAGGGPNRVPNGMPRSAASMGAGGFETCVEEAHYPGHGEEYGHGHGHGQEGRFEAVSDARGIAWTREHGDQDGDNTDGSGSGSGSGSSRGRSPSAAGGVVPDGIDTEISDRDDAYDISDTGSVLFGRGYLWRVGRAGSSPLEQAGVPFWRVLVHPADEARRIAGQYAREQGSSAREQSGSIGKSRTRRRKARGGGSQSRAGIENGGVAGVGVGLGRQ